MSKRFSLLFLAIVFIVSIGEAQNVHTVKIPKNIASGAQYFIGDENQLLMQVNVWGRVEKPGQYYVPSDTDLITLISVAGGPADKSRLDNVRVVRAAASGSEVIQVNIKKFLKTGDNELIPKLMPQDTILVSGSAWYLFSTIISVVAQLAIVANVYYLASLANK